MPSSSTPSAPARQGFYLAHLADGRKQMAEWRAREGGAPEWWEFVLTDPTKEKQAVRLTQAVVKYEGISRAEVARALERPATPQELIEKAYQSYLSLHPRASGTSRHRPPPHRVLAVGDRVEVGNLSDCYVVALHDEGQLVTLAADADPKQAKTPSKYLTVHWTDALPWQESVTTLAPNRSVYLQLSFQNIMLEGLYARVLDGSCEDSADYQRGYAWSDADKDAYLKTLFEGRELGRFILVRRPFPLVDQILDGKQRLSAIVELVTSQRPYSGVYWHQMARRDRVFVADRVINMCTVREESLGRAGLLELFLAVNAAGVPQTEEHLDHVRELHAQALREKGSAAAAA